MVNATKVRHSAVYGRESKGKTKSVADQIKLGEAAVPGLAWVHAGTYSDKSSASRYATKARGDWARLRGDLETGAVNALILWEGSRGSRTLTDWSQLLDLCISHGAVIHILSHDRTYDPRRAADYKQLATDGVEAAAEVHRSSERIRRGVAEAAVAGLPHGRVPYGYERVYGASRAFTEQRGHPDEAPIAREIITRVAAAEPLRSIVRDLRARGIAAPRGGEWAPTSVWNVVRSPAYIGKRRHNGELHDAVWPAIVSETMWRLAQAVLDQPDRRTAPPGGLKHLMSAVASAPCGGHLTAAYTGRGRRYRCVDDGCSSINADLLDEWVTAVVCARLSRPDARAVFAPDDAASAAASEELARLERQLEDAQDSYAQVDGISEAALVKKERALAPLIEDARRRSRTAGVSLAMLSMLDAAAMGKEHVQPAWEALPLPAKRDLIKTVCASIVVPPATGMRLTRWSTREERLQGVAERVVITPRTGAAG